MRDEEGCRISSLDEKAERAPPLLDFYGGRFHSLIRKYYRYFHTPHAWDVRSLPPVRKRSKSTIRNSNLQCGNFLQ